MDAREMGSKAMWHLRGLSGLQETEYGNVMYLTINPNQRNLYKERAPQNTCINKNLSYKERPSPPKNEGQLYTTIKTSKPSQIKVRVIFPSSGTLELYKFSLT